MNPAGFVAGPRITPTAELLAWLQTPAQPRRRIRLPVVVEFDELGIRDCFVGDDDDRLAIRIDDTALGISLVDRLRGDHPGGRCVVWLEGYWGALVSGGPELPEQGEKRWPFAVLGQPEAIADLAQAATAFVAVPVD